MSFNTIKVIHILSSPSAGGAEIFVKDMALNSEKHNIKPAIVFMSNAEEVGRERRFEENFLKQLNIADIPFVILPKGSRRNPLGGRSKFKKFMHSFNPDCIHTHLLSGVIYTQLFSQNKKLIHTHHSSTISSPTFIFKLLMHFCDSYIGISKSCGQFLNALIPKKKKCEVIYNAIDIGRLTHQSTESICRKASNKVVLLAVGRISLVKNYALLLSAINDVHKQLGNTFELRIAGEGNKELVNELKNYVKSNSLSDIVTFLGNISDVPEQLRKSDIFVMSSNFEGLSIALLEAQIMGLPAIVTDVGGCREVIDITNAGIVVPPHAKELLSSAIIQLITDKEQRQLLADNALKNSRSFSIDECLNNHYNVYHHLIENDNKTSFNH
jgi:glycosyltransferase involved in cell wall biosynthesis